MWKALAMGLLGCGGGASAEDAGLGDAPEATTCTPCGEPTCPEPSCPETTCPETTCPEPEAAVYALDEGLAGGDLASWEGEWSGQCEADGYPSFAVELTVAANGDDYDWLIAYEGSPLRPYTMESTGDPREWVLDENNGIRIPHHLAGDVLYGLYSINGLVISLTFLRHGDRLDMMLPAFSDQPQLSIGPGGVEVNAHPMRTVQHCTLMR